MNFVQIVFTIPLKQLRCYKESQLETQHWNC